MKKMKIFIFLSILINSILVIVLIFTRIQMDNSRRPCDTTSNVECNIFEKDAEKIILKQILSTDQYQETVFWVLRPEFLYEFDVITTTNDINLKDRLCVVAQYNSVVDVKKINGNTYIFIRALVDVKNSKIRDSL